MNGSLASRVGSKGDTEGLFKACLGRSLKPKALVAETFAGSASKKETFSAGLFRDLELRTRSDGSSLGAESLLANSLFHMAEFHCFRLKSLRRTEPNPA